MTIATPPPIADAPAFPAPGIHPNIPSETYHALAMASNSWLSRLKEGTPAHVKWEMTHPRPRTPALIIGDAFHLLTLQPELFGESYTCGGSCCGVTKAGKACSSSGSIDRGGQWYCRLHDPGEDYGVLGTRVSLSVEDYDRVHYMRDRVMDHPEAGQLLQMAGPVECAVVFDDPETGLRCKMRADKLVPELGMIVDLKTTDDASEYGFAWSVKKWGYHRQAAMYQHGLLRCGMETDAFVFVAVEKDGPCEPACRALDDAAVAVGREELRGLMKQWKECEQTGVWPGYGTGIGKVSLPDSEWYRLARLL